MGGDPPSSTAMTRVTTKTAPKRAKAWSTTTAVAGATTAADRGSGADCSRAHGLKWTGFTRAAMACARGRAAHSGHP